MVKLLLAIDGGGSKTHAVIADLNGRIVEETLILEGSNPWKSGGYEHTAHIIGSCLDKLTKLHEVVAAAAGISGCHSDSTYTKQFYELLAARLPENTPIAVEGDLIISFRASSPAPFGQLAIAGSGSAIAHFYPNGTSYAYDGIGYGGRDIGAAIVASVQRGEQPPAVTEWLTTIINETPVALASLVTSIIDRMSCAL